MNQVHRPQRYARKYPFPHILFAVEEAAPVKGDLAVFGVVLAVLALLLLGVI